MSRIGEYIYSVRRFGWGYLLNLLVGNLLCFFGIHEWSDWFSSTEGWDFEKNCAEYFVTMRMCNRYLCKVKQIRNRAIFRL